MPREASSTPWRASLAPGWRSRWASRSSSKIGPAPVRPSAWQACANAKPDGHTICPATADALSYNPQLFANLPYDPEKSFTPVIMMALTNNLLVANAKAPFNTYKEMIAYAKANPGKLNWGTWGPGDAARPLSSLDIVPGRRQHPGDSLQGRSGPSQSCRLLGGSRHHLYGVRSGGSAD